MRPSISLETGERLTPETVTNIPLFTRYIQQELGLDLPLGNGRRQGWHKFAKEEMDEQGWEVSDLVVAVQFIKARKKKCNSHYGVLWHVRDAKEWAKALRQHDPHNSLHLKVAEAIAIEEDEAWARRLSLARGVALEVVYSNWLAEREQT